MINLLTLSILLSLTINLIPRKPNRINILQYSLAVKMGISPKHPLRPFFTGIHPRKCKANLSVIRAGVKVILLEVIGDVGITVFPWSVGFLDAGKCLVARGESVGEVEADEVCWSVACRENGCFGIFVTAFVGSEELNCDVIIPSLKVSNSNK